MNESIFYVLKGFRSVMEGYLEKSYGGVFIGLRERD